MTSLPLRIVAVSAPELEKGIKDHASFQRYDDNTVMNYSEDPASLYNAMRKAAQLAEGTEGVWAQSNLSARASAQDGDDLAGGRV